MAVSDNNLGADLREAVAAIDGVTLKDSPNGIYYTVKLGTTTLGYVNGRKKFRVDFPIRGGERKQFVVTKKGDIAKAVKQLKTYVPKEA